MGKGIKTREVVKEIKVHDTAVNVGDRMKNIGVKTKDTVNENINQADNVSPEQYATDKVSESIRTGTETVAVGTEKAVRKGVSKAKEKIQEKKAEKKAQEEAENEAEMQSENTSTEETITEEKADNETPKEDSKSSAPKEKSTEPKGDEGGSNNSGNSASSKDKSAKTKSSDNAEKTSEPVKTQNSKKTTHTRTDKGDAKAVKEKTQAPPKVKEQTETNVDEIKKPRQRKQSSPKTKGKADIKKFGAEKKTVKTVNKDAHKIKQSKRSLDNAAKTIKKADKTAKAAKKTVKTTASTTKKTAEIAKKTKQTAQATARVTIKTVKVAAKVVVEAGKAVVAGVKSIGAIIAGGGVPAVVVIIIICLIGAIGGTCFGIFLANDETTGTNKTMSQAISELTSEHYANLTAMKASYTYDLLEVKGNTSINWKDVLAVYAVKTTSGDNPLEVVTLDDTKIDLLRDIMKDMNTMTGVVTPKVVAETTVTTDENGNSIKTTTYVTKKVLTVSILQLSVDEISALYNFNDEQKALLEELMSEEYNDLWAELLGASGQIIQGNSSFVGTGMFAWPFENDQYISSRFGTRVDPISGEIKTHGGTDIAAPLGTPILAAADGVVITATWHNSYGYYVKIKHDDTYSTLYAHCSALHVSAGQTVKQGQVIADCGSTGYSTGPHCHFEVIQNGVRVDALMFYKSN
ncbi:MAG: peptidoglycan DD-metalloendopeptidase family protein [Clostridia bacterium]|nr:peptidoglycan DD-metalloendopeptidase family protein [Clostridia bacterium]